MVRYMLHLVFALFFLPEGGFSWGRDRSTMTTRRFAPRAGFAVRYARSGMKNTTNCVKRTEEHD